MKNYGQIITQVSIIDMAAEGKCVAKVDGMVVFVHNVAPGDVVDIKLIKKDKKFYEAVPVHFHEYSNLRSEPFCQHFGICGGCKWQHLTYETQLNFKQKQVKDALERIAKVQIPAIKPILGSNETTFYRNKLEYTFSNQRWFENNEIDNENKQSNGLGFHIPGRFDKILNIEKCHLQADPSNNIRNRLFDFCIENNLTFFDLRKQVGLMRNLIIRIASATEIMVIVQFFYEDKNAIQLVMNFLRENFPEISSLLYVVNTKGNETIFDQNIITFHGKDRILEQMEDLKFRVGPKSFYQTNSNQAYELYKITRQMADIQSTDVVYDLYTGTGTIANFVARQAKKVIGVEYVEMAIEDAKINSTINNISNTAFYAGDMAKVLNDDFVKANGKPDIIITDPPRAGMDEKVVQMLLKIEAKRIVYVSCNPATQARDLAILDSKYEVMEVQPVDMFPHTHHVENIVKLQLKIQNNG